MRPGLLMLTHRVPFPPDRGDRIRSYHLLKLLSRRFDVSLACVSEEPVSDLQRQELSRLTKRLSIERISPVKMKAGALRAVFTGGALTPAAFRHDRLARTIARWHAQRPFDAMLTFCTGMIEYTRPLQKQGVRHVLDLVDVDSVKWTSYARAARAPMRWVYRTEARRLREVEAGRFDRVDAITVVSEREAKTYRKHVADHPLLSVVGNGVALDYFAPQPDAGGSLIVFVGVMDYKPNVDGVVWFCDHVLPGLRQSVPGATFRIVGRDPDARVRALANLPGVEVTGPVADVREHLREATVVAAPLRIARGVQNKVLEAMASARAVVCSPHAAEGIDAEPGRHLLVADTPLEWVARLAGTITDHDHRRQIALSARKRVEERYDWDTQLNPMLNLLHPATERRAA